MLAWHAESYSSRRCNGLLRPLTTMAFSVLAQVLASLATNGSSSNVADRGIVDMSGMLDTPFIELLLRLLPEVVELMLRLVASPFSSDYYNFASFLAKGVRGPGGQTLLVK